MEVNCVDNYGKTPFYYAVKYGNQKVARLLESKGAQKNREGKYVRFPAPLERSLDPKEAIIWYLGSCGWAVKTQKHFLIFDYWEYGRKPADPSLANGHIQPEEIKDMNVYVFITHAHVDHYDPVIFEWEKSIDNVKYIFGWKAKENPAYIYMPGPRETKKVDQLDIYTINSHHVDVPEVAYLVKVDGLSIYFNGDYSGEVHKDIDYLSTISDQIDLAFAEGGASVTSYMLEKLQPFVWFPMHERGTEFKHKRYVQEVEEMDLRTKVLCVENRGDHYFYSNGKIKNSPTH
jgi:L-ascorbate metabolism protein UlaG (beta-lactamase superfamily)